VDLSLVGIDSTTARAHHDAAGVIAFISSHRWPATALPAVAESLTRPGHLSVT
jgi:hypothetical protein